MFLAPATGKQIEVSDFVISVRQGVLTAEVNGNPTVRVPLKELTPREGHRPQSAISDEFSAVPPS